MSSKGQVPFVELNGRQIADSNIIIETLKQDFGKVSEELAQIQMVVRYQNDMDPSDPKQQSLDRAFSALAEDHLTWYTDDVLTLTEYSRHSGQCSQCGRRLEVSTSRWVMMDGEDIMERGWRGDSLSLWSREWARNWYIFAIFDRYQTQDELTGDWSRERSGNGKTLAW